MRLKAVFFRPKASSSHFAGAFSLGIRLMLVDGDHVVSRPFPSRPRFLIPVGEQDQFTAGELDVRRPAPAIIKDVTVQEIVQPG